MSDAPTDPGPADDPTADGPDDATAKAEAAFEALRYAISHDLASPVRHLVAFSKMLDQRVGPQLEGRDRQILDHVASAANRLDAMLAGMIRHARLLKHRPTAQLVDLGALVQRVVDARLASTWRDRLPEGCSVEVVVGDQPATVATDGELVTLVVEELLDNAIGFHDAERPNQVVVELRREAGDAVLLVRDTGMGMRHDFLDRAVKLFGRLVTESEHPGVGVGLSVAAVAVDHLGGTLDHQDVEPHGSAFTVRWPVAERGAGT